MSDDRLRLTIHLDLDADGDAEEVDRLAGRLRQRILELDVDSVERLRAGDSPSGARGVDLMALGGLVVTLAHSPELLKKVLGVVLSWVGNDRRRSIELKIGADTIKLSNASEEDQRQLVAAWVLRHTA